MPQKNSSSLLTYLELLLKVIAATAALGGLVGGACFVAYLLNISYFPTDLSFGSSVAVLAAAFFFGILYIFLVVGLLGLSVSFSPLIRLVAKLIFNVSNLIGPRREEPGFELAKFSWLAPALAMYALLFIAHLGRRESFVYWQLPILSVAMYFCYSLYISFGSKVRNKILFLDAEEVRGAAIDKKHFVELNKLKQGQLFMLGAVIFTPLALGGVSMQLIEGVMRKIGIREENRVVFVKEPYASMVPVGVGVPGVGGATEYKKFVGVDVLFSRLGDSSLLSFSDAGKNARVEIPNSFLVVQ